VCCGERRQGVKRSRLLSATFAVVALTVSSSIAAVSPAQSAVAPCAATRFAPGLVPVGENPTMAVFGVGVNDVACADMSGWRLRIPDLDVDVDDAAPAAAFDPDRLANRDAGVLASVDVRTTSVDDGAAQTIFPYAFRLVRNTGWGTTASISPTRIKPGGRIHATGTVFLVNWDTVRYDRYASRHVSVQWRLAPGYIVDTVATGRADARGNVSLHAQNPPGPPRGQSGYFRLHYGGNSIAGPSNSAWVHVTVSG
jgi:hypothetical protein